MKKYCPFKSFYIREEVFSRLESLAKKDPRTRRGKKASISRMLEIIISEYKRSQ